MIANDAGLSGFLASSWAIAERHFDNGGPSLEGGLGGSPVVMVKHPQKSNGSKGDQAVRRPFRADGFASLRKRLQLSAQPLGTLIGVRIDTPTIAVEASACEVEATATGESDEKAAEVAEKLTEGRCRNLPARGPASTVFEEMQYCEAANFTVVITQLRNPTNQSLF